MKKDLNVSFSSLTSYVQESNAIEGISAFPGNPFFEDHLKVVKLIANDKLMHPNEIHGILFSHDAKMQKWAGKYRECEIHVGCADMPQSRYVAKLMEEWEEFIQQFLSWEGMSQDVLSESADFLHCLLLCIHPYVDGNGRTARLIDNMLRLQKGLPWKTFYASDREAYYSSIERVEYTFHEQHSSRIYK